MCEALVLSLICAGFVRPSSVTFLNLLSLLRRLVVHLYGCYNITDKMGEAKRGREREDDIGLSDTSGQRSDDANHHYVHYHARRQTSSRLIEYNSFKLQILAFQRDERTTRRVFQEHERVNQIVSNLD